MRNAIAAALSLLIIQLVPVTSDAFTDVTVGGTLLTTIETINGKPSIRIAGTYRPASGGTFVVSDCLAECGSTFPARVFVNQGASLDTLVLTDAKITTTTGGILTIISESNDYTALPAPATYPYALSLNGVFLGTLAKSNSAQAFGSANGISIGPLSAPPFASILSASFNKQATQSILLTCGDEVTTTTCTSKPFLRNGVLTLTFQPNTSVRLPGSVDVLLSRVSEENGGVAVLANALADLHAKGTVLRASLEPSPGGSPAVITIRGVPNSLAAWVVDRKGNGTSKTRVEISSGGVVKVKADGLCPAAGCPATNVLDISVFCAEFGDVPLNFENALALNKHGNGHATVLSPVPCTDPLVLIMDPLFGWAAAPAVLGSTSSDVDEDEDE